MRQCYTKILSIGLLFFCLSFLDGQNLEKQIRHNSQKLIRIKNKIDKYKKNLKEVKNKERTLYSEVQQKEEKIILIQKRIRQLNVEIKQKELQINQTTRNITNLEQKLNTLKEQYKNCIVHLYKKNKYRDLELLLTSNSINQAIYRFKYLHIFKNAEEKVEEDIRTTMAKLNREKQRKIERINEKKEILNQKYVLKEQRKEQKQILEEKLQKARQNKKSILAHLEEKRQALKKLRKLVANLEKEQKKRQRQLDRERAQRGINQNKVFSKSKGNLIWPAQGKIVKQFGKNRNEKLNTITNNPGVDISAKDGAPVRVVYDGVVSEISYIRGFGNIVIVDHGSNYYTVYAHVENIRVFKGDYVSRNTKIAQVSRTGSLEGTVLHFEIWHKQSKLNPTHWLGNQA